MSGFTGITVTTYDGQDDSIRIADRNTRSMSIRPTAAVVIHQHLGPVGLLLVQTSPRLISSPSAWRRDRLRQLPEDHGGSTTLIPYMVVPSIQTAVDRQTDRQARHSGELPGSSERNRRPVRMDPTRHVLAAFLGRGKIPPSSVFRRSKLIAIGDALFSLALRKSA